MKTEQQNSNSSDQEIKVVEYKSNLLTSLKDIIQNYPSVIYSILGLILFILIFGTVTIFIDTKNDKHTTSSQLITTNINTKTNPTIKESISTSFNYSHIDDYNEYLVENVSLSSTDLTSKEIGEFLVKDLLVLKKIDQLLTVDVQKLINSSNNKQKSFDEYFDKLSNLTNEGLINHKELLETEEIYQERLNTTKNQFKITESNLNQALIDGTDQEIYQVTKEYIDLSDRIAKISSRSEVINNINTAALKSLQSAEARLAGLKANKTIIIEGLKVIDIDGSGLDLIQNNELTQKQQNNKIFVPKISL